MTDITILVPSVKHSGGATLVEHILSKYTPSTLKEAGPGVIHDHVIYTIVGRLMDLAEHCDFLIVPVRHPKVVAHLWAKDGEELMPDFFQMWSAIEKYGDMEKAIFLPMDADNLEERLREIIERTGLKLTTNPVLGEAEKAEMALRAWQIEYSDLRDGAAIQELVDDAENLIKAIYEDVDPEAEPTRKQRESNRKSSRTKAPANTWEHVCPIAKKKVFTQNEELCPDCGAEA